MATDEGGLMMPDGSATPLKKEPTLDDATVSWRDRRLAQVCGDKKLVLCIHPDGEPGWLYLERAEDIVDFLIEGEPGDEWNLKWVLMSQEEIDAMPEHPGW